MSILASIEYFVQLHFGDFFSSIEAFYLKDILILIQGILEPGHNSISSIARDPLNNVAHTTLTRFVNGHPDFWNNLEKLIQKVILSTSSDKMILVVDDTQLARRSKKIPFTTLTYDHNQKRYCQAQILLTVGRVSDGFFPLEMMFSNSKEGPTKIERLIDWLKENEIRDAVLLGDSWYTNSHVIESCKLWFGITFIGKVRGNLLFKTEDSITRVSHYQDSVRDFSEEVIIRDKTVRLHQRVVRLKSVRVPLKIVVAELDDGRRTTLVSSDTELSSEDIFLYYLNRWSVESYFKTAKQHFSLGKAGLSTEDGQKHWIILVILAYLIFNDLHRFILEKTESQTKRYKVFETIQRAISMLRSLLLEQVEIDFHLLDSCFRSPSLAPFY